MAVKVETPPILGGTGEQQIKQVYAYLFRLAENLNVALNNLTEDNFSAGSPLSKYSSNNGLTESGGKTPGQVYNELKSLIINTAEVIRHEMDLLEVSLSSEYEAISSQWGSFQESIDTKITATAESILQELNYQGQIDTVAAEFNRYKIETSGYIKSGFIDYDENGVPIIGIAIGQNLKSVSVTMADGTVTEQIDSTQNCAFYTSNKLSFRINGQEVAYLSNSKLYIHNVEITGKAVLGGNWELSTHQGFMIKWIGGN